MSTRVDVPVPSALLVSLPWTSLTEPSLGLGILRAVLDQQRIPCRVMNLSPFLLEHLKATSYYALANVYALNDFLFSGSLDPALTTQQRQLLRLKTEQLLAIGFIDERPHGGVDGVVEELLRLRREVIPFWLAQWADEIAESDATLIGFTCMFDQTIASIALARMIKERAPQKIIALGGYAIRPPTAETVLRAFSFIDAVCVGEGESVIGPLTRASAGLLPMQDVPGMMYRAPDGTLQSTPTPPPVDLEQVPVPNYDDFFADLARLTKQHKVEVETERLPIENSRGCWWGQKKHCVFCGIKDSDLIYRHRSSERVRHDLEALSKRYQHWVFRFSDYILPSQYYKTLLPELASLPSPYQLTCEVKANLDRERVLLLAAAGFDEVQPGIESFSDDMLRKMDKGVTGVQNVYTLLLGKRFGVEIRYNLLYGLPQDDPDHVERMVAALPRLAHLDPPSSRLQIQVTRYAPLQVDPIRFGITPSPHESSYDLIFSNAFLVESGFDLDAFCYYFEIPFEPSPRLQRLHYEIDAIADDWTKQHSQRKVELSYEENAEGLSVFDSRRGPPTRIDLNAAEALIVRLLEEPMALEALKQRCLSVMEADEFTLAWKRLDALGLVFHEGRSAVALILPRTIYLRSKEEHRQIARAEVAAGVPKAAPLPILA